MIRFTFVSSLPHYTDHLAPLWFGLPADYRDTFIGRAGGYHRARELGISAELKRFPRKGVCVVAGYQDLRKVDPAPAVLVNHGAGQTYSGSPESARNSSYSGGDDRDNVILHICPSRRDAELNWATSHAQVVAAGPCKLDPWISGNRTRRVDGSIAVSFHADAHVCPESQSAFPHYRDELVRLTRACRFKFLGHAHPRAINSMSKFWSALSVPFAPSFDRVLDHARVYVCDTSSTLYEAAATGIPVVVLDAPWYRRDVEHGLRFWEYADVGIRIDDPRDLDDAIELAIIDPPNIRKQRQEIVRRVYDGGVLDGHATDRAVAAMMAVADGWS